MSLTKDQLQAMRAKVQQALDALDSADTLEATAAGRTVLQTTTALRGQAASIAAEVTRELTEIAGTVEPIEEIRK